MYFRLTQVDVQEGKMDEKDETTQDSPVPKYFYNETEKKDMPRLDKINLSKYNKEKSNTKTGKSCFI